MMNRRYIHISTFFFLITLLVVFLSWMGNIYAWEGVKSLLRVEGVRWFLRSVQDNFMQCPVLSPTLFMFMGLGVWSHSGMGTTVVSMFKMEGKVSRKDKYALFQSVLAGFLYLLLFVILIFGPWDIVKSAFGTLKGSPISLGLWFVISLGIGFMGLVYGFLSDNYHSDKDVVSGLSYFYRLHATYFVTLFFISQFFNVFHYSGLYLYLALDEDLLHYIYVVVGMLPLHRIFFQSKGDA